jgi:parvulin-like peptidyl-prolyl isomerase
MSSRTIPYLIAIAVLASSLALAGTVTVAAAPADSTAAASFADSTEAAKDAAKETAEAAKDEAKKTAEAAKKEEAAKEKEAAKARKSAKKTKIKAAAGGKGTVKPMETEAKPGTMPVKPDVMPQHVQVQHILIGFAGSVPGKAISRSKDEAKTLAYEVLDRARKGENFDELVRKYTDDSPPGIYGMSGTGVAPAPGEYSRDGMVAAFGNVGFSISPGNIGIADYDATASPFGWHIIKRLK